jgi:hypothetical protein
MKFCYDVDNTKEMHTGEFKTLEHSPQKHMTKNSQIQ